MSAKYIKVQRKVLGGPDAGTTKTYGRLKSVNHIDLAAICHLVSGHTSLSSGDVKNVFDALIWVMEYEIKRGSTLQLGDVGTFRLSISTDGVVEDPVNKIKFTANNIKKARLLFTPGKALLSALSNMSFEAYEVKEVTVEEECEKPHAI